MRIGKWELTKNFEMKKFGLGAYIDVTFERNNYIKSKWDETWIVPDGIDEFKAPAHWEDMDWSDYADGLRVDLLSPNIYWFRD